VPLRTRLAPPGTIDITVDDSGPVDVQVPAASRRRATARGRPLERPGRCAANTRAPRPETGTAVDGARLPDRRGAALITLATCAAWPELSTSDQCLADALRARRHRVTAAPWNGAFEPFRDATAAVVRSTWDYHHAPAAYLDWLARLDAGRTFNAPALIRWNVSKDHVLDLARRGVPVPRSLEATADADAIAAALRALDLREAVIKPLVGASGFGVQRVTPGTEAAALERARCGKIVERVLVQEFLAEIVDGELAGVFFDGAFSHGLRRTPAPGEFRINAQYGGTMSAVRLSPDVVAQMTDVVALLPGSALYARVDGIVRDGRFVLMEVEVNEPGLGLHLAPGSAARFADALLRRLPTTA
jgi:glutathione synthase/RimK-type ligase-like ATP-grasp enzyme